MLKNYTFVQGWKYLQRLIVVSTGMLLTTTAFGQNKNLNEFVRVRLQSALQVIEISGQGIKVQGGASDFLRVAIPQAESVEIKSVSINGKDFWQVSQKKASKTNTDGDSVSTQIFSQSLLALEGGSLIRGTQALPSRVLLARNGRGIDLIGIMPLEDYLAGVLASEMPLRWPMDSLKAQAIAARSYSLAVMKERRHQLFHLESSIQDQVFRHVVNGVDSDPLIERAVEAVRSTQNMVLLTNQKKTLKAYYHADCGGETSSAKAVWGYGDSFGQAADKGCPSNPHATWSARLGQKTLAQKLSKLFAALRPSEIFVAAIEPLKLGSSQRADKVKIKLVNGQEKLILADKFRSLVGYSVVRSTNFQVKADDSEFVLQGRGFGHGVGLCQWGSRVLANQKQSYDQILKHYYPQASLGSVNR